MPTIYTKEWYDSLKEILNRSDKVTKSAPRGHWKVLGEVRGDETSPYLKTGDVKRFEVVLEDGKCTEYTELDDAPPRKDFDFILELPATLFEGVVANAVDPVQAGLKGDIKITGDIRMLIQNAELVNVLANIYASEADTDWPKGQPPYK
jgi:putative sterol carrier protein